MSFNQLPAEVLEVIFYGLDGASFCSIQAVCKSWHKILGKMQDDNKLWQSFCTTEIPNDVIEEMLSYKRIPFQNLIIDWKNLYKKWYQGKLIRRNKVSIESMQAFFANPVTCMKASGSWIITGHSNGCLCIWNQSNGKLSQRSLCHLRTVTDLALVDLQNLGSYYGFEILPWSHHHIISISKDSCIKLKCLLEPLSCSDKDIILNKHGDILSSVKVFGNHFAVSCRDNTVTLWSLNLEKHPYFHLEVSLLRTIIGPQDILLNLGFWYDKVYCVSHAGRLRAFNSNRNEWLEETYFKKCLATAHESRLVIIAYYLFRDQTILMCSAGGKLIVSIDEDNCKAYNLMATLQTLIVSIVLKGTTLALGGENGRLYVYHVPTTKSLLDLDLLCPAFRYTLSEASIIALDILYDYDTPIILASTTESLFIVKWFPKKFRLEKTDVASFFDKRIVIEGKF